MIRHQIINNQSYIIADDISCITTTHHSLWENEILDNDDIFYGFTNIQRSFILRIHLFENSGTLIKINNLSERQINILKYQLSNLPFDIYEVYNDSLTINYKYAFVVPSLEHFKTMYFFIFNKYSNLINYFYTNNINDEFEHVYYDNLYIKVPLDIWAEYIRIFLTINNLQTNENSCITASPCVTNNLSIKLQLSDIIFNIKELLTDIDYKSIMDKLYLIK